MRVIPYTMLILCTAAGLAAPVGPSAEIQQLVSDIKLWDAILCDLDVVMELSTNPEQSLFRKLTEWFEGGVLPFMENAAEEHPEILKSLRHFMRTHAGALPHGVPVTNHQAYLAALRWQTALLKYHVQHYTLEVKDAHAAIQRAPTNTQGRLKLKNARPSRDAHSDAVDHLWFAEHSLELAAGRLRQFEAQVRTSPWCGDGGDHHDIPTDGLSTLPLYYPNQQCFPSDDGTNPTLFEFGGNHASGLDNFQSYDGTYLLGTDATHGSGYAHVPVYGSQQLLLSEPSGSGGTNPSTALPDAHHGETSFWLREMQCNQQFDP
ncbi:hypothetical protein SeLEV6574_g00132 [Synchytrium endobioticum]|uniref:Uncharacterized protein n=1 Tax=Synchytrium endobioticum TaxID=286115 RepID=A0A507DKC9_9FUNG|nr:hypothetical protein SeLEV6574_g00132 [Synchytrium endobioticum]